MPKEKIIQKAEKWEVHHQIVFFCLLTIGAIVITRIGISIYYPGYLSIDGTRLHHFDYGLVGLLIGSQLALFGPKKFHGLYIFIVAISSALILDEYWMIRSGVDYNSLGPVAILCSVFILVLLFAHSIKNSGKKS